MQKNIGVLAIFQEIKTILGASLVNCHCYNLEWLSVNTSVNCKKTRAPMQKNIGVLAIFQEIKTILGASLVNDIRDFFKLLIFLSSKSFRQISPIKDLNIRSPSSVFLFILHIFLEIVFKLNISSTYSIYILKHLNIYLRVF